MGLSPFRHCSVSYPAPAPNPSPSRWELMERVVYDNSYLLKVRYLDCTNYEGVKLLVFAGKYRERLVLDPHFAEGSDSPIARFKPDEIGWRLALRFTEDLSDAIAVAKVLSGE